MPRRRRPSTLACDISCAGDPIDRMNASVAAASATSACGTLRSSADRPRRADPAGSRCRRSVPRLQRADQCAARDLVGDQAGRASATPRPSKAALISMPASLKCWPAWQAVPVRPKCPARHANRCCCRRRRLPNRAAAAARAARLCCDRSVSLEQFRRADRYDAIAHQAGCRVAGMRGAAEANRQVNPFSRRSEQTRVGDHLYVNTGCRLRIRARRGSSQCDATEGSIVTFKGPVSSLCDRSTTLRSISLIACSPGARVRVLGASVQAVASGA